MTDNIQTQNIINVSSINLSQYKQTTQPKWYLYLAKTGTVAHKGKTLREHMLETGYF